MSGILQFYDCDLEDVAEFAGFEEYFETFPLFRGKKSLDDEDDEVARLSGYFKVLDCIAYWLGLQ